MKRLLSYNPNLKQSWMLFIFVMLCGLIIRAVMSVIMQYTSAEVQKWNLLFTHLLEIAVMVLIISRLGKHSNYVPVTRQRQSSLLWFLLVPFILSIGLMTEPLTMWIPMPDTIKQQFADLFQRNLPSFLVIVIIGPIYEEWLYRGIILKGLLTHYSPEKSIVWSAVIFSVVHANPWQSVSAFFFALAIGWIYLRTRSLWYCVFMHVINNAAGFLLLFLTNIQLDTTFADIAGGYYIYPVALFVGVLATIGINKIISPRTMADKRSLL